MKTHLDWSSYDTYGIGDAFSGVPIRGGNYAKAVAVCMHNRACQKEGRGGRWFMVIATKKLLGRGDAQGAGLDSRPAI